MLCVADLFLCNVFSIPSCKNAGQGAAAPADVGPEMQPVGFFLDWYRYRSELVRPDRHESSAIFLMSYESYLH